MIYFLILSCFMVSVIRALHWGGSDVMWLWDEAFDLGVNIDLSGFLGIGCSF